MSVAPSGELADEDVGEFVEALDRAAFGGGGSGLDTLVAVVVLTVDDSRGRVAEAYDMGGAVGRGGSVVGVEREQGGVADAGVDGDGSDARVRGEDGERQLGLGVGREARVAASAVGIAPLDGAGAVQEEETLTTRPPGSLVSASSSRLVSR